ncbi:MAG TPA: hypothetical protein VKX40_12675 [Aequorivita sp.]|nr:hypothetical protein [Aequorivita sp.]
MISLIIIYAQAHSLDYCLLLLQVIGWISRGMGFDTNYGCAAAIVHSATFDLDLMNRGFDTTRNDAMRPEFT